jgi:hypothetical protein
MSFEEFETGNWNEQAFLKLEPFRTREAIMLLDALDGFAELVDQPGEAENEKMVALAAKHDDRIPDDSVLDEYGLVPGFSGFRESLLTHRQQLINMRLALRLARRYRETGTLPASLEDIVDESLPQIQLGLLSQRPLVYRVFENAAGPGFEIYDVGLDGVDNGGTMEGGDWAELDSRVSIRFK